MSLTEHLSERVGSAFIDEDLPQSLGKVALSRRPDLCQFQCNGALVAAKTSKNPPRVLAETIAGKLRCDDAFAEVVVEGPGFININLDDAYLANLANIVSNDERLGVPRIRPKKFVVDYGGPNTAKPMHVGHLRSTIIGASICRLLNFMGHNVVGDIHLGDWGNHIGMLITQLASEQPDLPFFNRDYCGSYPSGSPVTISDLQRLYPAAVAACKADPKRDDEARAATLALQSGHSGYLALWKHISEVSIAEMRNEFEALGVTFDRWDGEASVHHLIAPMVEEIRSKGIAKESDGALVISVADQGDSQTVPPLILLKSDGAALYSTTDLATIVDRAQRDNPDYILYVVDQRQALHFEQVFRAAKKSELAGNAHLEHVGFGTVNGSDGRPFKTREGGVMRLSDLISLVDGHARKRLDDAGLGDELGDSEREAIAHQVAIAAIKFADLSHYRMSDYIFDLERFTALEGKTGPYLQYATVRIKSLLRRARKECLCIGEIRLPSHEAERGLLLQLGLLPDAIWSAYIDRAPDRLCEFAYTLAQEFSRFYTSCHIIGETDLDIQSSRLGIAELTFRQLDLVLSLLGIDVPNRM